MNPFDDEDAADKLFGDLTIDEPLEGGPGGLTEPTYRWRELDQISAPKAWTALAGWVSWFVATYRLTSSVVPDCWWRHPELVAELYALQKAELASYTPTDPGFGPLGFHERLPLAIERLRQETRTIGCVGLQVHRETSPRLLPTDDPEFLGWSTKPHQEATGKSGTAGHVVGAVRTMDQYHRKHGDDS